MHPEEGDGRIWDCFKIHRLRTRRSNALNARTNRISPSTDCLEGNNKGILNHAFAEKRKSNL